MQDPIPKTELLDKGILYGETVKDALEQYESVVLRGTCQENWETYLLYLLETQRDFAYADFYYPVLSKEAKAKFLEGLSGEELEIAKSFPEETGDVFYRLNEKLLRFFVGITAREWLFSTFYFAKPGEELMIWGNYHLEFPVFANNKEVLERQIRKAQEYGLEIIK